MPGGAFRVTMAALAVLPALGGCQQAQEALADRGTRYCLQAGGLGAAGGALAGGALGRVAAGGHDNTGAIIAGAVLGGIAGGLAGCRYGIWVAERRAGYESAKARLEAETRNVAQTNESLAQVNGRLREGLDDRRRQLARASEQAKGSAGRVRARQQLASTLERDQQGAREQLETAERELDAHRKALAELQAQRGRVDPAELAAYRAKVQAMEQSVAELRQITRQYAAASGRVAQF